MPRYDESGLLSRLAGLPATSRVTFSAACAQRLVSLCEGLAGAWDERVPGAFLTAVQAVWQVAARQLTPDDVSGIEDLVDPHVPHDDDEAWVEFSAYLQAAGIALIHALRSAATGEPQRSVFVARHLYETANYAAEQRRGSYLDVHADEPDIVARTRRAMDADLDTIVRRYGDRGRAGGPCASSCGARGPGARGGDRDAALRG
ncbi:hypothetical protein [Cellulomonas sp.]|uniref:hypothetical protein n=1 Tax=Cellulomonas sp. TaxID=40001 RepID=UPI003BACB6AD